MSSFSNVRVSKGGKLLADKWVYDEEAEKGHFERDIDVSENAVYFLMRNCGIEEGIVFEDILLLTESLDLYPVLSPLFTRGPWLKELVDEGLTPDLFNNSSIDELIIGWICSIQDDYENEGQSVLETYVHTYGKINNDNDTYGIDFTPLYELKNCKIVLAREVEISDEQRASFDKDNYPTVIAKTHKEFTLFEILHGLFWELSFHGSPKNRQEKLEEIQESIRQIDSGEAETIPWEEVKEKLQKKLDSNKD